LLGGVVVGGGVVGGGAAPPAHAAPLIVQLTGTPAPEVLKPKVADPPAARLPL
jgi:hypothetical protein